MYNDTQTILLHSISCLVLENDAYFYLTWHIFYF